MGKSLDEVMASIDEDRANFIKMRSFEIGKHIKAYKSKRKVYDSYIERILMRLERVRDTLISLNPFLDSPTFSINVFVGNLIDMIAYSKNMTPRRAKKILESAIWAEYCAFLESKGD